MSPASPLGPLLHSFFLDHLIAVKGLRPGSVRSYRDTIRLLLVFLAEQKRCKITRLTLEDLTLERILAFLRYLEEDRGNHIRTRNQRLAAIHSLFEYIATRSPEMLAVCQQVAAIPMKRVAPPETHYLERDEVQALLHRMPSKGRLALRDQALILFFYNTGARVQEAADLRVENLNLVRAPDRAPARQGRQMADLPALAADGPDAPDAARLARSATNTTVSGVHRERAAAHPIRDLQDGPPARHAARRPANRPQGHPAHVQTHRGRPHARGRVEVNVIREWLGHVSLDHHQPLRGNQHQHQARGTTSHRPVRCFRGTPHHANLADRRNAAELALLPLRYVPEIAADLAFTALLLGSTLPGHITVPVTVITKMFRGTFSYACVPAPRRNARTPAHAHPRTPPAPRTDALGYARPDADRRMMSNCNSTSSPATWTWIVPKSTSASSPNT